MTDPQLQRLKETNRLMQDFGTDMIEWLERIEAKLDKILKSKCDRKPNGKVE